MKGKIVFADNQDLPGKRNVATAVGTIDLLNSGWVVLNTGAEQHIFPPTAVKRIEVQKEGSDKTNTSQTELDIQVLKGYFGIEETKGEPDGND